MLLCLTVEGQGCSSLINKYNNFRHIKINFNMFEEKMMKFPLEHFLSSIPDHRRAQGLMHQKEPLLIMIILANMSGCYGYREMANFMKNNIADFKELFELKYGVPKHVSLRTFIQKLNFTELLKAFRAWADQFVDMGPGEVYSFDGKGLNSTVENSHNSEQNFKSMVSLFCHRTGLVADTEMIELKKNHEIGAVQQMIERLQDKGITLIGDALHCQKKQQVSPEKQAMITS